MGKKGLGHITRSGIVMLCAAFEVYTEELIEETIEFYIERYDNLNDFPKNTKKTIANFVKTHKNELEPIKLASDGWKDLLRGNAKSATNALNTPNSARIDDLFDKYVGIRKFSDSWSNPKHTLDNFVKSRGEIAHNGSRAMYIRIQKLREEREFICCLVREIDEKICDHIKKITPQNTQPWRKTYS